MDGLGPKIKKLRLEHKHTQQQLGDKIGVSKSYVSKLEAGTEKPNLAMLDKIAEALNVDIGDFFDTRKQYEELSDAGADWIVLGKEMEKEGITPEQLKEWVKIIKNIKNVE